MAVVRGNDWRLREVAAHVCAISQLGMTALIIAANCGHTECVRLLVEAGADANAKTDVRDMMRMHLFSV